MADKRQGVESDEASDDDLAVRECTTVEEFDACVRLQREAFGLPDLELSPRRHLIVARSAGGWTLGAFAGARLVGFVLNQVAVHEVGAVGGGSHAAPREVIGYSHMMAVAKDYQNRGVGARLKWAQRGRALSDGVRFVRWTWDPVQSRNAHFNLNRLGVEVRGYAVNYYGTDYSTATGEFGRTHGLDSDRLVAEWRLDGPRVERLARGLRPETFGPPDAAVEIPPDWSMLLRSDPAAARAELLRVRTEFRAHFAAGLVCSAFDRAGDRPRYLLYKKSDE